MLMKGGRWWRKGLLNILTENRPGLHCDTVPALPRPAVPLPDCSTSSYRFQMAAYEAYDAQARPARAEDVSGPLVDLPVPRVGVY